MRKKLLALSLAVAVAASCTGCIKVIDKGTEGQYTGKVEFSAESSAGELWEQVVADITENATDLPTLLTEANGKLSSVAEKYGTKQKANFAVKGTGVVTEVNTEKSAGYIIVQLDGYTGSEEVKVQVGPTFKNKDALGDSQNVTSFENYTNQTEWGQIKDALIENVKTNVIAELDVNSLNGKTVTFIGACAASSGSSDVQIIPVSLTAE